MIYIVRHGQTGGNKAKVLQGRGSNLPLNDTGVRQAEAVRRWFEAQHIAMDLVYSSPLLRAVQTAQIIAGVGDAVRNISGLGDAVRNISGLGDAARNVSGERDAAQIRLDDRLLEMDYGPYEGADLMNPPAEVKTFFSDFVNNPAPAGMEPLAEVVSRMGAFLEMIRPDAAHGNILISTHAIAMKGALEYLTPQANGMFWGKYIRNCALYAFEIRDGKYTVPKEVQLPEQIHLL